MAYQIVVKKRFTNKVQKVLAYLEKEWSPKVAAEFLAKIDHRIEQLSAQPNLGAPSSKVKGLTRPAYLSPQQVVLQSQK